MAAAASHFNQLLPKILTVQQFQESCCHVTNTFGDIFLKLEVTELHQFSNMGPRLWIIVGKIKDKKPLNSSAGNEDLTVIAGADVRRAEPVGQGHCTANGNLGSGRQILHHSIVDGPGGIIKKAVYPVRTGLPEGARKVRR